MPGRRSAFSLSHSQSFAVIAVATGARVGVDIEVERPRARLDALAARVLGSEEHADWLDVPRHGAAPRVPRALDHEGGVPQGDRRRHHGAVARRSRSSPKVGRSRLPVAARTVARSRSRAYAVVQRRGVDAAGDVARTRGRTTPSRPIDKFRNTAVGLGARGRSLGLARRARARKDEKVAIVQDYAGDPPFKDPIVLAPRPRPSRGLDRDGAAVAPQPARRTSRTDSERHAVNSLVRDRAPGEHLGQGSDTDPRTGRHCEPAVIEHRTAR